jgi:hypothetical protein
MPHKVTIVEHSRIAKLAAKKLKSDSMAITIGNKIYLHNISKVAFLQSTSWLCHELKHVQQFRQHGYLFFILKYLWESFRKGYYNNKWEIEARTAEKDFSLLDEFEIC